MPLMFDDIPDSPAPAQAAPASNGPLMFDDLPDGSQPQQPEVSTGKALVAGAAENAVPTVGGAIGGVAGAGIGALVGGPIGALVGGVAGGGGGGFLGSEAQDWVLDKLGLRDNGSLIDRQTQGAAQQQHPYAYHAGGLLDSLLAFGINGPGALGARVVTAARAVNAAIMGGIESGQELANEGKIDLGKVALSAGAGAVLGNPRSAITKLASPIERAAARVAGLRGTSTGAVQNPVADEPGTAGRPDLAAEPTEGADKPDIEVANDATTTAKDVALENSPAPEVVGAGNPVGAPMAARGASKPSDPNRNYGKGAPAGGNGIQTAPSATGLTSDAVDPAVSAALSPEPAPAREAPQPPIQTGIPADIPPFLKRNPDGSLANPGPMNSVPDEQQKSPVQPQAQEAPPGGTAGPPGTVPVRLPPGTVVGLDAPLHVPGHVAQVLSDPEFQAILKRTPVNRTGHVPYIAGADANDNTTHIDASVPRIAVLPGGERFETAPPMILHEQIEKFIMQKLIAGDMEPGSAYKVAHWGWAEPLEDAWYTARGIDPRKAEKWWADRGRPIEKAPSDNTPKTLYTKPYPHDNVHDAHEGGVETQHPDEAEKRQAADILGGQAPARAPVSTPAPEAPVESGKVTAAVTPEAAAPAPTGAEDFVRNLQEKFPKTIERLKTMGEAGAKDWLRKFAAMSPEEQRAAAEALTKAARGTEGRRPTIEGLGVQARTAAQAETRGTALKAIREAVQANAGDGTVPTSTPDRAAMLTRLKALVAQAEKEPAVVTPEKGANKPWAQGGMRNKPPEVQIYVAAKKLLAAKNPSVKQFADMASLEKQLSGPGAAEAAKETQATSRINADIDKSRRPQAEDVGATLPGAEPNDVEFDPFDNSKRAESQTYVDQQNAFRDWWNGLNRDDRKLLLSSHPEIETDANATNDPARLHDELQNELENLNRARTQRTVFDTGAEDTTGISKQVLTADEIAAIEQRKNAAPAEDKGRSRADLIAEYNAKLAAGELKGRNNEGRLESETIQNSPENIDANRSAISKFLHNEAGTMRLPSWADPGRAEATSPRADPVTTRLVDDMPGWFKSLANKRRSQQAELYANSRKAQVLKKQLQISDADEKQINLAAQMKGGIAKLPENLRRYYSEVVAQPRHLGETLYEQLYHMNKAAGEPLGPLVSPSEGIERNFMHRRVLDSPGSGDIQNDPLGKTLSSWRGVMNGRDFDALTDQNGNRFVFKRDTDSEGNPKISILRNGVPVPLKNLPDDFEGKIGDTLPLRGKWTGGKTVDFAVDHADTDEITKALGGRIKYDTNPVTVVSDFVNELQSAIEHLKTTQKIEQDPRFKEVAVTKRAEAIKLGYKPERPTLPQFSKYYVPDNLRWVLNDFFHPGFGGSDANWFRQINNTLARVFLTFGSEIHVGNVLTNALIGRGWQNLNPMGYRDLGKATAQAFRAVRDINEDYHAALDAGLRLQFVNHLTSNLLPDMQKRLATEIAQNPGKWDLVSRLWQTNPAELAKSVEKLSTGSMWWQNDLVAMARWLELKNAGMNPKAAAEEVHKFVPAYDVPSTVLMENSIGRFMAQVLREPAVSLFGPYHYDLIRGLGTMTRNLIKGTPQERLQAAGQMAMGAMFMYGIFPALDKFAKWVSGNDDAEVGRRGVIAITDALSKMTNDDDKQRAYLRVVSNLLTPSIPIDILKGVLSNKDFRGKNIMDAGLDEPDRMLVQFSDWLARTAISPYGTISSQAMRPDATTNSVLGGFAAGSLGVHLPSDKEAKYERSIVKQNQINENNRLRRPPGLGEAAYEALRSNLQ